MKIIEKLCADNKTGPVTIAFLGDSVTHGYFESIKDMHGNCDFEAVYHNQLKLMLNKLFQRRPINIINAGVGGQNSEQAYERLNRDVISKNPDLTVVCFGLNDVGGTIERYVNSLDNIFKDIKAAGSEVIFMTPNMLNTYVALDVPTDSLKQYAEKMAKYQNEGRMDEYIGQAKECAKRNDVPVCDCYSKWKKLFQSGIDTTMLLANRINHPKREMHQMFAYELLNTMIFQD